MILRSSWVMIISFARRVTQGKLYQYFAKDATLCFRTVLLNLYLEAGTKVQTSLYSSPKCDIIKGRRTADQQDLRIK